MSVAIQQIVYGVSAAGRAAGNFVKFICDTQAELPTTNVINGDFALALDTGNPFTRVAGVWVIDTVIPVVAVRVLETGGPTSLLLGSITDGQYFRRMGATVVGQLLPTLVNKTTTETIVSNAALHNDTVLLFPMLASSTYRFRMVAFYDSAAAADFKFRHTGPAAPVSVRIYRHTIVPAAVALGNIAVDTAYSAADVACLSASVNGGFVVMDGVIANGVNAGNFQFQWAQNTSNAGNTSVLAGSHLEWWKL